MSTPPLVSKLFAAFASDIEATPSISLRGGDQLDDYKEPSAFDPSIDSISDGYLEKYRWGVTYLDAASWRHYLPYLVEYTFRHMRDGSDVGDALLNSLRPPDREPPRLASLNAEQEVLVTQFLDALAFGEQSAHQELACQVLEEWWVPGALYRGVAK
jgi:hypothetical protein